MSIIKKRIKNGQKIFDDPILYVDRIDGFGADVTFHVKQCRYFHQATKLIALEEETFHAALKKDLSPQPVRQKFLPGASILNNMPADAPAVAECGVVVALRSRDTWEILIHRRSMETISGGNTFSCMPLYSLSPLIDNNEEEIDILYNNFIREYLEELFNYEVKS